MLQSTVRSDQRIAIYWPKSYLLVLFIITVKAGVVPAKTDSNAMNLTRRYRERKTERKKGEGQKKKKKKEQIPNFVSSVGVLSVEIRTGNCSKYYRVGTHTTILLWGDWTKNDKTALSQCVPSRCLWYQRVRQKSALKIAAFRVSYWLRSATAWGLRMGQWKAVIVNLRILHCQL